MSDAIANKLLVTKRVNSPGSCSTERAQGVLAVGRKAMVGAFAGYVGRIGADPADADDVHMRKALISGAALAVTPLAFLWTGFLAAYGELGAAAVPFSYAALTLFGLLIFAITRQYLFIIGLKYGSLKKWLTRTKK